MAELFWDLSEILHNWERREGGPGGFSCFSRQAGVFPGKLECSPASWGIPRPSADWGISQQTEVFPSRLGCSLAGVFYALGKVYSVFIRFSLQKQSGGC